MRARSVTASALSFAIWAIALAAIIAPGVSAASAAAEFHPKKAFPNTVAFWNGRRGLLGVGDSYRHNGGAILRTSDGGRSFEVVLRTNRGISQLDTAGARDAWATVGESSVGRCCGGRGYLLHSSNGGRTWQKLPGSRFNGPSFGTTKRGISAGAFATGGQALGVTWNGGKTWHEVASPCSAAVFPGFAPGFYDTVFPTMLSSTDLRVVCSGEVTHLANSVVFTSRDAGTTWHEGGSFGSAYLPTEVGFSPDGRLGFAIADDFVTGTFISRNGGTHWTTVRRTQPFPYLDSTCCADMISASQGFVLAYYHRRNPYKLGGPARLIFTQDAGRTWTAVHQW